MAGQQRTFLDDAAQISMKSTAAVARALKSAEEAREVATDTLKELATQTDTLVRRSPASHARRHATRRTRLTRLRLDRGVWRSRWARRKCPWPMPSPLWIASTRAASAASDPDSG